MFNVVDSSAPYWRATFRAIAKPQRYTSGGVSHDILVHLIGAKADGLFAAAQQQDVMAQIDAAEFRAAFGPSAVPGKFDRLRAMSRSYTVEETKGRPNNDDPVFFAVLLRGGQQ